MGIFGGVEAILSMGDIFYNEYVNDAKDFSVNGVKRSKEVAMLIEFNEAKASLSLNLRLIPNATEYDALGFLLLINGEATNFRFYQAENLVAGNQILSYKDPIRGQNLGKSLPLELKYASRECIVELKVFRMQTPPITAPDYPIDINDMPLLVGGQMLSLSEEIGRGNQVIVSDDVTTTTDAIFMDGQDTPWMSFEWKCEPRASLERLLAIPRSPALPDYKLLPDPKLFPPIDLTIPIGELYLTQGCSLAAIDNLAFQQLKGRNLDEQSWEQVLALARTGANGVEVMDLSGSRIGLLASLELNKATYAKVHALTLRVLECVDDEDLNGYASAVMKTAISATTNLARFNGSASGREITPFVYALSKVEDISNKELRALCKQQSLYSDSEILQLPYGLVQMFAVKRIMEERYMKAKVQVLRVLAEERLLQLQKSQPLIVVDAERATTNAVNLRKHSLEESGGGEISAPKRRELGPVELEE